jgi:ubiquinone/menaquinone biosynthesis C-methylase UbiE
MYKAEESHWWYRGMDSITRALLKAYLPEQPDLSILDAGCGTGMNMSGSLPSFGAATGVDISSLALEFCKLRKLTRLANAAISSLPFPANSFDAVICLDVLYSLHVKDDSQAIREIHRVLKPRGVVLIRVAAYEWMRARHDLAVHTGRRYTIHSLKKIVEAAGFSIQNISYANCFLFPIVAAKRILEKWFQPKSEHSDTNPNPGLLNPLLKKILSSEASMILRTGLPFGSSVICVGMKE